VSASGWDSNVGATCVGIGNDSLEFEEDARAELHTSVWCRCCDVQGKSTHSGDRLSSAVTGVEYGSSSVAGYVCGKQVPELGAFLRSSNIEEWRFHGVNKRDALSKTGAVVQFRTLPDLR
jgi:hypothetical protein